MPKVTARDMNMLFLRPPTSFRLNDSMTVRPPSAGISELCCTLIRLKGSRHRFPEARSIQRLVCIRPGRYPIYIATTAPGPPQTGSSTVALNQLSDLFGELELRPQQRFPA
jgi:hypothetical protein